MRWQRCSSPELIRIESNRIMILPSYDAEQSIFNEDAIQWVWTAEVGFEMEVVGPFDSVAVSACARMCVILSVFSYSCIA